MPAGPDKVRTTKGEEVRIRRVACRGTTRTACSVRHEVTLMASQENIPAILIPQLLRRHPARLRLAQGQQ